LQADHSELEYGSTYLRAFVIELSLDSDSMAREEDDNSERLQNELALLKSMYPDSVVFRPDTSELAFQPAGSKGTLILRLPSTYPESQKPLVMLAVDANKKDVRKHVSNGVQGMSEGDEILDEIVQIFLDCLQAQRESVDVTDGTMDENTFTSTFNHSSKTVIIWLHHLLNTNKRKLALNPPSSTLGKIKGVTKPGYPGVLLFTGPADAVNEHVKILKGENWQAFQVRYESEQAWRVADNGKEVDGVVEVETMAGIVKIIEEGKRELFLKSIGVK
jgi:hypothetical protein